MTQEEIINNTIEQVRAGKPLYGSFMHDHGLPTPIVSCSSVRFEQGTFIYKTWYEEPVVGSPEESARLEHLNESDVREVLLKDDRLRSAIGL